MTHVLLKRHWLPVTLKLPSLEAISAAVVLTLTKPQLLSSPGPWRWMQFPVWAHSVLFWSGHKHGPGIVLSERYRVEQDTCPWRLTATQDWWSLQDPRHVSSTPWGGFGALMWDSLIAVNHGATKSTVYQVQGGGLEDIPHWRVQLWLTYSWLHHMEIKGWFCKNMIFFF